MTTGPPEFTSMQPQPQTDLPGTGSSPRGIEGPTACSSVLSSTQQLASFASLRINWPAYANLYRTGAVANCYRPPPARCFLRRLIDLSTVVNHLQQFVRLALDLTLPGGGPSHTNGMALYAYSPQLHGSWGCAALTWFQLQWPPATAAKEMIPIVIAAILWGKNWQVTPTIQQS